MNRARFALVAGATLTLLLAGCATGPNQTIEVSGRLPPLGAMVLVQPDKTAAAPAAGAVTDAVAACLGAAGYLAGQPATTFAQVAHAVRPARAVLVRGGSEPPRGRRASAHRDREDLTLAFTDPATGALQWRGTVTRQLRKHESAGDGAGLVGPLCATLRYGPAAAPR